MHKLTADMVPVDRDGNLDWRRWITKEAIAHASSERQIIAACRADPVFFINSFVWTKDPRIVSSTVRPMILWERQVDLVRELTRSIEDQYSIHFGKSRDQGASCVCMYLLDWRGRFFDEQELGAVSRKQTYVDSGRNWKALFTKVDLLQDKLPSFLGRIRSDRVLNRVAYTTGSTISGETTTGDAFTGDRRTVILVDEHARFDFRQGYQILDSVQHAAECVWYVSTPQGVGNAFFAVRETIPRRIELHWSKDPRRNRGLYRIVNWKIVYEDEHVYGRMSPEEEESRAAIWDVLAKRGFTVEGKLRSVWYDRKCAEAPNPQSIDSELDIIYHGSGSPYFNEHDLERLKVFCRTPERFDLQFDPYSRQRPTLVPKANGRLLLWCPLNNGVPMVGRVAIAADIGQGVGASNSIAAVIDETGRKVAQIVAADLAATEFAEWCWALGFLFGRSDSRGKVVEPAALNWESGGPGGAFGKRIIKNGYDSVYMRSREGRVDAPATMVAGWDKKDAPFMEAMTEWSSALIRGEYQESDQETLRECRFYRYDSSGKLEWSPEGGVIDPSGAGDNHADRVIATMLCWKTAMEKLGIGARKTEPRDGKPTEILPNSLAGLIMAENERNCAGERWSWRRRRLRDPLMDMIR